MSWILYAIFGAWGGSSRWWYGEEGWLRNPPWCLACIAVLGALVAIGIGAMIGSQLGELTFIERALLGYGSGVAGVAVIAGGLDALSGKGGSTKR